MTQETASRLIEENLSAIYGYAYAWLYDKSRAEDLSSEIILAILESAENLKTEAAFWGFAWRIAENTLRTFLRRERLAAGCVSIEAENLVEVLAAPDERTLEEQDERIHRLRRELSLLSRRHRDVCVSYYIHGKSCAAIAAEQSISVDMVKQLLFHARKRLKEGMEMERRFGEKSYDPGTLRLDFWGDWNHYGHICDRKLPGAILLCADGHPMTAEELSVEVGVAMPYLEEELESLEAAGLLKKRGKRYETAIVILKNDREKAFAADIGELIAPAADRLLDALREKRAAIRALDFHGNGLGDERLLCEILNITLFRAYEWSHFVSPAGEWKQLPLGGHGIVFGYDNNYENNHFAGVATQVSEGGTGAWFTAVNYRVTRSARHFDHSAFQKRAAILCDAIREKPATDSDPLVWLVEHGFVTTVDGRLSACFPVFAETAWDQLMDLLRPDYEAVAATMLEVSDRAEARLAETASAELRDRCADIAKIHHRMNVAALIMESLIERGMLTLPAEKTPIGVFGVRA